MTATANLSITKIDASQAQKEVTANEAFDVFDAALSEKSITMTDANYTLSTSTTPQEWQYGVIKLTGTLTVSRNVIAPTNKKEYTVVNATTGGYSIVFKTAAGTGVTVSNGITAKVRCDGTNVEAITVGTGAGTVTSVGVSSTDLSVSGSPVTGSGSITLNINNDAITYAKMQNVSATDKLLGRSTAGAGDVEEITCTAAGRALIDDADAAAQRATLGLGTLATQSNTLSGTNTGDETTTTIGTLINGATSKTTPVDADYVGLMDSEASNILKKLSWANIKATLKTYFDTLYAPLTQPFSLSLFYPGAPTSSALVGIMAAPAGITTLTFAAAISGSSGKALTAATAQTDFDVRKNATTNANGTSVGTIRFAASGTVPTFIAASGFTLTGGADYLTIWAPASPDATLADIGVSLYGTR